MAQDNKSFIKRSFYSYLLPSILSILGGNISIMVDNCIAGAALGEQALAAMSIVNPIFNTITAFGLLICGGASTLASVSIGRGNQDQKKLYFTLSFFLVLAVGCCLTVVGLLTLNPLVTILGATEDLFVLARDYCRVMIGGSVVLIAIYFPLHFFRIEGKTKMGMVMFFIMSGLDIVLDLLFVLVFKWGMSGLALATIVSSLIAIVVVFPTLLSKQLGYRFVRVYHHTADITKLLTKGSPVAMGNLYVVARVRILNAVLISCGGSLALAVYGCANSVNIIGMALISGVSQTVAPIVGVLYGERDKDGIQDIMRKAIQTGCFATTGFWILTTVFSKPLALLFGMTSAQQLHLAQIAIPLLNLNLFFSLLGSVMIYYYATCNHTWIAHVLTLARGLGCNLLFAFIGAKLFGILGVLGGLVLSEIVCLLLGLVLVSKLKKSGENKGILLLPQKIFGEGESLAVTALNTPESITEAAQQAADFCSEHGLSPKQAMTVHLGVEEIMVLMSKYALSLPKEYLEFRLFISDHETVLRIRCGGKWFNPLCFEAEDEFDNLGIKMLVKMATDLSYSTNLGVNNIKITIAKGAGCL